MRSDETILRVMKKQQTDWKVRSPFQLMKTTLLLAIAIASIGSTFAQADPDYSKTKPEMSAVISKLEAGVAEGQASIPWRLFVPEKASKENPLPLVVFLHGAGKKGNDNIGPMSLAWSFITPEAQAKNPCFVLAPQVPINRLWVSYNLKAMESVDTEVVEITPEMAAALELVDEMLKTRPIDPRRVYVVGQSMGGYGTWDAMVRRPDLWAAAVPICGGGDPAKAEKIKAIPVWAWHGESDTMVPVTGSRKMIEALKATGAQPLYTEIAKGGHGVWIKAFADPKLYDWLFAQKKP